MRERPEDALRRLFAEIAPPVDASALADRLASRPETARRGRQMIAMAGAAALLSIGVVTVLTRNGPDADVVEGSTTAAPSTTIPPPSSTVDPSATTTTLDQRVVDRLELLDSLLSVSLDEVNRMKGDWENRQVTYAAARSSLVDVVADMSEEALDVAESELIAEAIATDYPRLVDAVNRAVLAAESIVVGIDAPDDGTLRTEAVARFAAVVDEARAILKPYLPPAVPPDEEPTSLGSPSPGTSWVISTDGILLGVIDESGDYPDGPALQVLMAARDTVLNDARYGLGATFLQRKRALFGCPADDTECEGGGGLKIYTTVDFRLQEEARRILQEWFPPGNDLPTRAIAMVDNRTGATAVMSSRLDFGTDLEAGQRQYDLATKGRRNPESAFMPFGLVAALEQGIPLNSYWDFTTPQTLDFRGIEPWECHNAGTNEPGIRTLEEALYRSTNTVFCQVSIAVGPENIVEVAHRMGIKSPLGVHPSIVLGSQAVSPLEMASAFSTIANYGLRTERYLIERIEDADGNVVYQHQIEAQQVFEPALMAAVVNTMEKVISIGTGGNAYLGRPQFGKTGTHEAYRDAWYVGGIPQVTTAAWVGYPDAQIEMRNLTVKPDREDRETIPRIFGSSAPAPIWQEFMEIVVADMPVEDFPPDPAGTDVYYATPRISMPDVIGLDFEDATEELLHAGLNVDVKAVNSDEPEGTVVASDPEPGERVRQGTVVEIEVSNGLSPTLVLPDLIGLTRNQADQQLNALRDSTNIAFTWMFEDVAATVETDDGRVQAMVPGPGAAIAENDQIVITVWRYQAPAP